MIRSADTKIMKLCIMSRIISWKEEKGGVEGKLNRYYLRLIPELSLEDRMA